MQGIPEHVTIGLPRQGLNEFDDLVELKKHPHPYRIREIEIQYNDKHILGTEFKYTTGDGKHVDGHNIEKFKPFGHLFGQIHKKTFKIADDDELLEISGFAGARINHLAFRTYKGQHEGYGPKDGAHFAYQFPGHTFGAVSGGFETNLDYIRVHVNQLPEHRKHLKVIIIKE